MKDATGFLSNCPSLIMLGIAIQCIQHSQAMLERGVCELAHSSFHFTLSIHQMQTILFVKKPSSCMCFKEGGGHPERLGSNLI
mgnify:CR=1 FL=1